MFPEFSRSAKNTDIPFEMFHSLLTGLEDYSKYATHQRFKGQDITRNTKTRDAFMSTQFKKQPDAGIVGDF